MAYTGGMTVATPWFEQLQRQQATGAISGQQSRDLAYGGAEGAVQAVYAGERTAAQTALQERSVATGERAQANQVSEAAAARSAASTQGLLSATTMLGGAYLLSHSTALSTGAKAAYRSDTWTWAHRSRSLGPGERRRKRGPPTG